MKSSLVARSTGGVVIEDDYDGEFRYDRRPVGALQSLAPEHVVYAGTASKSLAPGVRLGWLVVPGDLLDPVLAARAHGDWPSALDQLTLAELIASGGYDRHVRRMRIAYRRRRDRLLATVQHVTGIDAGLHAVVELDEDEGTVVERARRNDLVVEGLDGYRFGESLATRRSSSDTERRPSTPGRAHSSGSAEPKWCLTPPRCQTP